MKIVRMLCLAGMFCFSCQQKKTAEDSLIAATFEAERNRFFMEVKTPAEVAALLQATGAEFNAGLMNDPLYYSSYTSNEVKAAANLGVYLSDFNYSIAYKQGASTKALFDAASELSKVVGIEQRMLAFLKMRYEQNINQNDSVKAVVDELLKNSTTGLQGTDREKFVGIVIAAYQIENLHLALGIIHMDASDNPGLELIPVYQLILTQQATLERIYAFLKTIADPTNPEKNPNFPYYATAFEELIAIYKRLNITDQLNSNQVKELLNNSVIQELTEKVTVIRNKIIGL